MLRGGLVCFCRKPAPEANASALRRSRPQSRRGRRSYGCCGAGCSAFVGGPTPRRMLRLCAGRRLYRGEGAAPTDAPVRVALLLWEARPRGECFGFAPVAASIAAGAPLLQML